MILSNSTKTLLCQEAMKQYDLEYSKVSFIRHSENLTYRIFSKSKDESYLLRIHFPLSGIIDKEWLDEKIINSELLWLKSLSETTDIRVQIPVANKLGNLVTKVNHDGNEIFCTLLTWIVGIVRYEDDTYTSLQAEKLGSLLAKIHRHSENWNLPKDFDRPTYNLNSLQEDFEKLKNINNELLIFDKESELSIQKAIDKIGVFLEKDKKLNNWGLIHADLCENNYILNEEYLSPIDFSLCSFGSYTYDITVSLLHLKSELWSYFFKGYRKYRSINNNLKESIEAYIIAALIGPWAFHSTNPEEQKWLKSSITSCLNKNIPQFLNNESYFFSKYNIDIE